MAPAAGGGILSSTVLVSPGDLDGATIVIEGDSYRHLFRAGRHRRHDRLRAVDGRGRARWCEVESVERHCARLRVGEKAPANEPAARLDLAVAVPRPARLSWLVEKGTEVGVAAFHFFSCQRCPRRPGAGTWERLHRVARAAVEQSGRARVPEISGVRDLGELLETVGQDRPGWILDPGAEEPWTPPEVSRALVLVGPEGGFTEEEIAQARGRGLRRVRVAPSVLRVETAALVAAVLVLLAPPLTDWDAKASMADPQYL